MKRVELALDVYSARPRVVASREGQPQAVFRAVAGLVCASGGLERMFARTREVCAVCGVPIWLAQDRFRRCWQGHGDAPSTSSRTFPEWNSSKWSDPFPPLAVCLRYPLAPRCAFHVQL